MKFLLGKSLIKFSNLMKKRPLLVGVFEPKFPKFQTSKWIFFRFFCDVTKSPNTKILFAMYFKCAKFQRNQRTFFGSSFIHHYSFRLGVRGS